MPPAVGVGIVAFAGILFVAYVIFLAEQHKFQNELARHLKK